MRNSIWYNASNYFDPTCGEALSRIIEEERKNKELNEKKQNSYKNSGN